MSLMRAHTSAGFSLIEIALVLVIVGLIVGSGISTVSTMRENADRAEAQKLLEQMRFVLYAFAQKEGRLPCPADPVSQDGTEVLVAGTSGQRCGREVGVFPWAAFTNMSDSSELTLRAMDNWGSRFTYHVVPSYADDVVEDTANSGCPGYSRAPTASSFSLCPGDANLVVQDATGTLLASGAAAVILSHGRNSEGAFNGQSLSRNPTPEGALEQDNTDSMDNSGNDIVTGDPTNRRRYIQNTLLQQNTTPTNDFDDLLIWISPLHLNNYMVNANKLP